MKILCFGDSNTYGYDPRSYLGDRYPQQHRWVDLLSQKIGCKVINAGENGREIPCNVVDLHRFAFLLSEWMPLDLLIIMLGTNDLLQGNTTETVCMRMEYFLKFVDLDTSKILLVGPPPMRRGEWVSEQKLIDSSVAISFEYKNLCERLGVRFVDTTTWDIPMTFDGVHFAEEGHSDFADRIVNYLNKENML